ncbi:MAG TPA: WD40 repeat domain-containing protein, partial [Gemmataceae bacterium]|nr:WD40 repeat domain-containing protein [Gemmataceae bacterium]
VAFAAGRLPTTASPAALALAPRASRPAFSARWGVALLLTGLLVAGQQLAAVGGRAPADDPKSAVAAKPTASERKPPTNPLPPGALARLGSARFRESYCQFYATAFAPDNRSLAAIDVSGRITLWRMSTGKMVRQFAPPLDGGKPQSAHEVHAFIAFSPDGKRVLAGMNRGSFCRPLFLWDTTTGKEVCRMDGGQDGFVAAAASPDFKLLAASRQDGAVLLWETSTGKRLQRWQAPPCGVQTLAFSPDGKTLALAGDNLVRLWEVSTGKERRRLEGHRARVSALAFHPDGKTLASADRDRHFILWDIMRGQPVQQWTAEMDERARPDTDSMYVVAFSPDGKTLTSGDRERTVALWSVPSGKRLRQIQMGGNSSPFLSLAADGKTLAVGGDNAIFLWDLATGRAVYPRHDGALAHLTFTPDGGTVHAVAGDRVERWSARTGEHLGTLQMVYAPILACGGRLVIDRLRDGDRMRVREVASGKELRTFETRRGPALPRMLSPDGRTLAVSSGLNVATLHLFDIDTGKELHRVGTYGAYIAALDFSPDGRLLATVDGTGRPGGQGAEAARCHLWDVRSGELVRKFPITDGCRTVAFSPDGRYLATCGWTRTIRLWEVMTGQEVRSWSGVRAAVNHVGFAPDGRTLASAERTGNQVEDDCSVHLWDVDSAKELASFKGHGQGEISALAFTADGKRLASGSATDGTVLVWDVARWIGRPAPDAVRLKPHDLTRLWVSLGSRDAGAAQEAIQSLARSPRDTVAFLAERLPERPEPALSLDGKRLARLLADLDHQRFAVREKATAELIRAGHPVAPALREHLRGERVSAEVRRRIEQVLKAVDQGSGVPPALARWLRAVEVLERIGTPRAREVLRSLTDARTQGELGREARATLKRLR